MFLLRQKLVNDFILTLQLDLNHLHASLEPSILRCQVVGRHPLLHDVVVETLSFLVDDPGAELADFEVDVASLGGHGLAERGRSVESHLFAEVELGFTSSCPRASLWSLCSSHQKWLRVENAVVSLNCEHLLAVACSL